MQRLNVRHDIKVIQFIVFAISISTQVRDQHLASRATRSLYNSNQKTQNETETFGNQTQTLELLFPEQEKRNVLQQKGCLDNYYARGGSARPKPAWKLQKEGTIRSGDQRLLWWCVAVRDRKENKSYKGFSKPAFVINTTRTRPLLFYNATTGRKTHCQRLERGRFGRRTTSRKDPRLQILVRQHVGQKNEIVCLVLYTVPRKEKKQEALRKKCWAHASNTRTTATEKQQPDSCFKGIPRGIVCWKSYGVEQGSIVEGVRLKGSKLRQQGNR